MGERRYEDNFDAVNNVTIIVNKADKGSIDGYGCAPPCWMSRSLP